MPISLHHSSRLRPLATGFLLALMAGTALAQDDQTNFAPAAETSPAAAVNDLLTKAAQHAGRGEIDDALRDANAAIELDPQNAAAYETRGTLYIQEKLWDRAERDYTTAQKLDPNDSAFKYKLAEIKFLQKSYDDARVRFRALEGDAYLGDLAIYKVFLCDLFGGRQPVAMKELAAVNQVGAHPSYYFCNAAWDLYHNRLAAANQWLEKANQIYDSARYGLYFSSLIETQRIHSTIVTFTTRDGTRYENVRIFVENTGLRLATGHSWLTIPFNNLPDDLSVFPDEVRAEIADCRKLAPDQKAETPEISFTTRQGKKYDEVEWSLEDTGLRILTSDGWIAIPFADLPDDLSSLPATLRINIAARLRLTNHMSTTTDLLTLTTRRGRHFEQVRANLESAGISLLTTDGWVVVPFQDLPDDLSVFPADWRDVIKAKKGQAFDDPAAVTQVTFTTKFGAHFQEARALLGDGGLRVLTTDGWVTVPYPELPDDLSPFPESWREQIKQRTAPVANPERLVRVITLTTKKGQHFDEVRAILEESGLRLLTSEGWVTVPFQQLPDDLSSLPEDWRAQIAARQQDVLPPAPAPGAPRP